ncbi:protein NEDD1-like [Lycium ferocissimum]|uniref:protein NEDD1-like n=1 Tax=Lycium ferocissimum TaxID=112874 RepID=UPI00281616CE|nr:protein NEDD1-like [Lycium ferocissimum]
MNSTDSMKTLLATSGGDTVKLFDLSLEPRDPCILSYTPSPGFQVNSVKWNHTNLVVASGGDDKKISLWRKNGQTLGTLAGSDGGDYIEESISTINFSSKATRYICSGGSGQVVRIWDLQRKRCIKWLKGHTDTISSVMYNCKDEHLASISLNGNLILHNLASGAKAAELKDPNCQVLRVLDYSKISRHVLVTAGDDGSVHLWDTTGRSPRVSWLKQHSAPTSGISISPSNDKIVGSVGMDKKLYTYDSGSRRPSFCIPYEAPFSSLAFSDDGFTLAAGTSSGRVVFYDVRGKPQPLTVLRAYGNSEAVTSLCWQRSKPVMVNESNCTTEIALLGSCVEDSILMPDPLPAIISSSSRTAVHSGFVDSFSFPAGSAGSTSGTEETPIQSSLWKGGSLARLHAPHNFKDDMDVFSPLVEVRPITPSFDELWDDHQGFKKDLDQTSLLFPSEAWGGERLSDRLTHIQQSGNMPSRFAISTSGPLAPGNMLSGLQDTVPATQNISSLTSSNLSLAKLCIKENPNEENSLGSSRHVPSSSTSFSLGTKDISGQGTTPSFSDGIQSVGSSQTQAETREKLLNSLLSRSATSSAIAAGVFQAMNAEITQSQRSTLPELQQRSPTQPFQSTQEETLSAFEKSALEYMRNLHLDMTRQNHMLQLYSICCLRLLNIMQENLAEVMKEVQLNRRELQKLRQDNQYILSKLYMCI